MSNIPAYIASIRALHGDEREQTAKHRAFCDFLSHNKPDPGRTSQTKVIPSRPFRESAGDQ